MDSTNLSEDDKKLLAGKCNFALITMFSTAAFICGLYSTAYCSFVNREVDFVPGFDVETACALGAGNGIVCTTLLQEHGVGFYAWEGTVPVDEVLCLSYTQYIPSQGVYVTPDFDTKFNSAKAFAMTANVLGAFAWFTLMFAGCCPISQSRLKGMACYFTLATLFQGLTLLIFRSSICSAGFFEDYFIFDDEVITDLVEDVSCSLDTGSSLAIAATVLYFVCSCLIPGAVAPSPILGYTNPPLQGDTPQEQSAPPTEQQEEQGDKKEEAGPPPAEKQGDDTEEGGVADTEYHA
jgi:hypothetical protein